MRVILLEDVERVGHEGDVITVADGYARNYLMPRKLAVPATKGALKDLERRAQAIQKREMEKRQRAQALANELATKRIIIRARTGQGGRLHGQVTPQMIAEAAKAQLHQEIDRRDIDIPEPIRELGDYLVSAKLYKDVTAQLPVSVVPETREDKEQEPAPKGRAAQSPVTLQQASTQEELEEAAAAQEAATAAESVEDDAG